MIDNSFMRLSHAGFTLAELLIALAILGVIATFTIPKILTAQQDTQQKAIGKEVAGMFSGAYEAYKQQNNGSVPITTTAWHLTPYMNYVRVDTASTIDRSYNDGTIDCSITYPCLRLHNGAALLFDPGSGGEIGNTAATNALYLYVDPDGISNPSNTGPGKSVVFWLYYNGRLTTWGNLIPNTYSGNANYGPEPGRDPPWFGWN